MPRYLTHTLTALVCTLGFLGFTTPTAQAEENVYDFTFDRLNSDKTLPLSMFKGKVLMVVNTASKCGFTKQYDGLEDLYNRYNDDGFMVIGVPSGDFAGQEFEDEKEIKTFCELNYGVTFPLTSKVHVKGDEAHPFYKAAAKHFGKLGTPKWNFHKYLINRDGQFEDFFASMTDPESDKIKKAVEKLLVEKPHAPAE